MALEQISLKIDTPTGDTVPGRGFYQLEEDSLYVQVGEYRDNRGFFNFLESNTVRFDIDKSGRLLLIEVTLPRRRWEVDSELTAPTIAESADIRWLDFRARLPEPKLVTNPKQTALLIQFAPDGSWRWFQLAEAVLIQADRNHCLTAVMITDIEDDLAGRQIAAFRHQTRQKDRRRTKQSHSRRSISG